MDNSQVEHILLVEKDGKQTTCVLKHESFSIGRHSSNSLVVKSKVISRYHATILPLDANNQKTDSFWIIDGSEQGVISTNGFTVNGESCLMHQLKPGDIIILPDHTKITYQIRENSESDDSEEDIPTGFINKSGKVLNNQVKIKTEFHHFLSSSRLDTRVYVQNLQMLCLLLEKEIEISRSKNQLLALFFIVYDFKKMQDKYQKISQTILRLYQLSINQRVDNPADFILALNDLEVVVLHGCSQQEVRNLANNIGKDLKNNNQKMNLQNSDHLITGAYSQIPENQKNIKNLIERVNDSLKIRIKDKIKPEDLFIDLNLLKLE